MASDIALRIEGLSKKYTIHHKDHDHVTLAQAALHRIRHPRGAVGKEEFWALRDVSLEVPRGQVLGVIGHNGAGKSTLLKILSRITPPTTGKVEVFGRIGSLLEVGTGFHPELTGRENIYLNGSILGMRTKEIDRQFDAIVDFSGVEKFLDTPVKRYSSGMYVRLAFAVAAHLDTEILLMDEVLAVGDAEFQKKCLGKMSEVAQGGRTVVFVSHDRTAVSRICNAAALMDKGRVVRLGTALDVLNAQSFAELSVRQVELTGFPRPRWPLTRTASLTHAEIAEAATPGNTVIRVRMHATCDQVGALVVMVEAADGSCAATADADWLEIPAGHSELSIEIGTHILNDGRYPLTLMLTSPEPNTGCTFIDRIEQCLILDKVGHPDPAMAANRSRWSSVRLPAQLAAARGTAQLLTISTETVD